MWQKIILTGLAGSKSINHIDKLTVGNLHNSFGFSVRFLHSQADDVDLDYQGLSVLASYFQRFNL